MTSATVIWAAGRASRYPPWAPRWLWTIRPKNVFPHYTDYYDAESRAFVAELYGKDIALFRYAFGAPAPTGSPAPRLSAP